LATSPCYRLKFNKNDNIKIGILFAELLKYVEKHKVVFWYVRPYGRVVGTINSEEYCTKTFQENNR